MLSILLQWLYSLMKRQDFTSYHVNGGRKVKP
jgi:hypothetical protein